MIRVAQIRVLSADARPQRRELGVDEGADERDDAADAPRAEDEAGVWTSRATIARIDEDPAPMIPPITIIVASNGPSRRASVGSARDCGEPDVEASASG